MNELRTVLFDCILALKKGEQKGIVRENIKDFIAGHVLTKVLSENIKDRLMVFWVGFYSLTTSASNDDNPKSQWKLDKRPPRPIQEVAKKFRDEMKKFYEDIATQQPKNTRSNIPLTSN